jgi:hypothetical protein
MHAFLKKVSLDDERAKSGFLEDTGTDCSWPVVKAVLQMNYAS